MTCATAPQEDPSTFRYCATGGERVEVRFSSRGTVTRVVRGA